MCGSLLCSATWTGTATRRHAGETAELIKVSRRSAWRRALPLLGGLLLVAAATLVITRHPGAQQAPPAAGSAPAVPVTVTKSTRQDVPVWLGGLGTVQALNTVLVRARVDGTLDRFPVTEGQLVKQGALLAVIDPRPYQAVLDQAVAKKAQDAAQLANAKLDLQRYALAGEEGFRLAPAGGYPGGDGEPKRRRAEGR